MTTSNSSQATGTTTPPPEAEIPSSVQTEQPSVSTPTSHLRRDSLFLSLAPVLSASYPTQPATHSTQTIPTLEASTAEEHPLKTRRSSSVSSGDLTQKRFLRLGPTFGGEKFDDFAEMED